MNAHKLTDTDNSTPVPSATMQNKTGMVKQAFVIGAQQPPNKQHDEIFTSPIAALPTGKTLVDLDQIVGGEPAKKKRRKRNPWTKEEDERLTEIVGKIGIPDTSADATWNKVAKQLNTGRKGKQCRDRWKNFLRAGIKKGDWTEEEEELIKDMHTTFGPRWSTMAKLLTNRTDNDIKNKWYSMKRSADRLGVAESTKYVKNSGRNNVGATNDDGGTDWAGSFAQAAAPQAAQQESGDEGSFKPRDWGSNVKAV